MTRDASLIARAHLPGPDLLKPPHVFTEFMSVFAGGEPGGSDGQEQLDAHLAACSYCRTAVIFMLCVSQEADRRSGSGSEQAGLVLAQFANIHRTLEAAEDERARAEAAACERMGAYAEAITARGRAAASEDPRFASLAAHVAGCRDCQTILDSTLALLAGDLQGSRP
jgi:hypothetical protein